MATNRIARSGLATATLLLFAGCSSSTSSNATATAAAASASTAAGATNDGVTATTGASGAGSGTGSGAAAVALPADWPAELALPVGVTPIEVTDQPSQKYVLANNTGSVQAVFDTLKQQLTDAGVEIVGSQFTPAASGGFGSISGRAATYTVAIAFITDPTGKTNQVDILLAPIAP